MSSAWGACERSGEGVGCGPLEMVVVGRARPWRASWVRSPWSAHGSCARTVGEDGTDRRGPQVSGRECASERAAPVGWARLVVREKAMGGHGRGERR